MRQWNRLIWRGHVKRTAKTKADYNASGENVKVKYNVIYASFLRRQVSKWISAIYIGRIFIALKCLRLGFIQPI
jgi:hypothetical protein